jgi:prevent-host-death family protein
MRSVTEAEARRHFSELLEEVRRGETILVTSEGQAVVELRPANERSEEEKNAGWQALLHRLKTQPPVSAGKWTRDELYDDE